MVVQVIYRITPLVRLLNLQFDMFVNSATTRLGRSHDGIGNSGGIVLVIGGV